MCACVCVRVLLLQSSLTPKRVLHARVIDCSFDFVETASIDPVLLLLFLLLSLMLPLFLLLLLFLSLVFLLLVLLLLLVGCDGIVVDAICIHFILCIFNRYLDYFVVVSVIVVGGAVFFI